MEPGSYQEGGLGDMSQEDLWELGAQEKLTREERSERC